MLWIQVLVNPPYNIHKMVLLPIADLGYLMEFLERQMSIFSVIV
uniref:Uncharacterized protein n=1 Tax=Rhizophora mucronata TaxID=61149 RepID=A0A2P2N2J7_RHIMU